MTNKTDPVKNEWIPKLFVVILSILVGFAYFFFGS